MAEQEKNLQQQSLENIVKQVAQKRINEVDANVLRTTFAGRLDLLVAVRNVLVGVATDVDKKQVAEAFKSSEVRRVIRKELLPELSPDDPLKQAVDLWMYNMDGIRELDDERVKDVCEAKAQMIEMLEWGLGCLEDPDQPPVNLTMNRKKFNYVDITARNMYIAHVETQLLYVSITANSTPETEEEKMRRIRKNSSQ